MRIVTSICRTCGQHGAILNNFGECQDCTKKRHSKETQDVKVSEREKVQEKIIIIGMCISRASGYLAMLESIGAPGGPGSFEELNEQSINLQKAMDTLVELKKELTQEDMRQE